MDNFKFNFLSRGQLESLNIDRIFLPLFITMLRGFFGNFFAIIARMLCGNHLNCLLEKISWAHGNAFPVAK